jgi:murein DD-endopeptidase MepM/ murein hydrolase activator NlpD
MGSKLKFLLTSMLIIGLLIPALPKNAKADNSTETSKKGIAITRLFSVTDNNFESNYGDGYMTVDTLSGTTWHMPKLNDLSKDAYTPSADGVNYKMTGEPVETDGWLGATLTKMKVSWPFGLRNLPGGSRFHKGIDLYAGCGDRVFAAQDGVVTHSGYYGAAGNSVIIDHGTKFGGKFDTFYMHMSKVLAKMDQHVKKGDLIGYVGQTGNAMGCHLHLTTDLNGEAVDPEKYFGKD